jgi:hypothetical protein
MVRIIPVLAACALSQAAFGQAIMAAECPA